MKFSLAVLTLLLASCGGDYENSESTGTVGELRSVTISAVSASDLTGITAICTALAQKEAILSSAVNNSQTFTASQTDCSGNTISSGDEKVTIQSSGANFVYKKLTGLEFIFPNLETASFGIMAEACANLATLTNPMVNGTEATYIRTTGINSEDCTPASGEVCVLVEKASIEGAQAKIHTKEWMRVRTSSPDGKLIGFFTQRKKISRSFCGQDEVVTLKATLK